MKKTFPVLMFGVLIGSVLTAFASTIIFGSLITVNNTTTNSPGVQLGAYPTVPMTVYVTNTGLTATTALTANWQVSIDNTNFLTVATFNPPATNAGTYTWNIAATNQPIYSRFQLVTTNSVTVGLTQ